MNPATHATEGSVSAPVLYMALELSNKTWRLAFSTRLEEPAESIRREKHQTLGSAKVSRRRMTCPRCARSLMSVTENL